MVLRIVGNAINKETGDKVIVCKSISGSKYISKGEGTVTLFTQKLQERYEPTDIDKDFTLEVIKNQNSRKQSMVFKCDFLE